MSKPAADLKPLKRDVDVVKAKFPYAEAVDLPWEVSGATVTFYAVCVDDDDMCEEWMGRGLTPRSAWADAARRVKAGLGLYNLNDSLDVKALA